jgi:hypothetical protein
MGFLKIQETPVRIYALIVLEFPFLDAARPPRPETGTGSGGATGS